MTETRITSETGGQKGQKLARFDLVDSKFLWELAEVCGKGALKYSDDNWRKGYDWKLSYGALQRHLHQFLQGELRDSELDTHHLANVAWHAMVLYVYSTQAQYKKFDTRVKVKKSEPVHQSSSAEGLYPHWETIRGHTVELLREGEGTIDGVLYTGQQLIDNIEVLRAGGAIGGMTVE